MAGMTEMNTDQAVAIARELHVTGRLNEAVDVYQQILQRYPEHAEAWHLRGELKTGQVRFSRIGLEAKRELKTGQVRFSRIGLEAKRNPWKTHRSTGLVLLVHAMR